MYLKMDITNANDYVKTKQNIKQTNKQRIKTTHQETINKQLRRHTKKQFSKHIIADWGRNGLWWPVFLGHWLSYTGCWQSMLVMHWLMPQSHPTTGPARFLSLVRFLARKAEWSARRNFTSVLFPWSHQATGPVRLDTSAYLWFGWIICRTPRVPRAMPVRALTVHARALYEPARESSMFFISHATVRGPCVTRKGAVRRPYGHVRELTQPQLSKIPHGRHIWPYGPLTVPARAVHGLFTFSKPVRGP